MTRSIACSIGSEQPAYCDQLPLGTRGMFVDQHRQTSPRSDIAVPACRAEFFFSLRVGRGWKSDGHIVLELFRAAGGMFTGFRARRSSICGGGGAGTDSRAQAILNGRPKTTPLLQNLFRLSISCPSPTRLQWGEGEGRIVLHSAKTSG